MVDYGLDLEIDTTGMTIAYGPEVYGPKMTHRRLDEIRPALLDPDCAGPDPVYAIAMDVGKRPHREELARRNLLFGVMVFAAGRLGTEPVRSQGHVHRPPARHAWSTPELYEVWRGRAIVLMQEHAGDDPGRCFAAEAGPGGHIVVPPGWAHATLSVDPVDPLVFGAWCDRDYGFVYDGVHRHRGMAWFASWNGNALQWNPNHRYHPSELVFEHAVDCSRLGIGAGIPIYRQFERVPDLFQWIPEPATIESFWAEI
jgi:glucose-6-phosphate isomerase